MSEPTTRPRDAAATRSRIVTAAIQEFARDGYGATTVRSIASAAGVSPNLITRYFGGKEGLFDAAARVRLRVDEIAAGPLEAFGARLADAVVDRWVGAGREDPLLVLLRSAGEHPAAAATLAELLDRESIDPLVRRLELHGVDPSTARDRARAVDVFLLGLTARLRMLRDDLPDTEQTRLWIADSIQRLVDPESSAVSYRHPDAVRPEPYPA